MSNYLLVLADRRRSRELSAWASHWDTPTSEFVRIRVARNRWLHIIAANAKQDLEPSMWHRGTALSSKHHHIAFGSSGWRDAPKRVTRDLATTAGEFINVSWTAAQTYVRHDLFGSVSVLYTRGDGWAGSSDSLLLLADLRRHFASRVTANEELLTARAIFNNHTAQQMSAETIVEEIDYVPAGQALQINHITLTTQRTGSLIGRDVITPVAYVDTVRDAAAFVSAATAAIVDVRDHEVELSLSGGYDSRVILAGATHSGVVDSLSLRSTRHPGLGDFEVADSLASRLRMPLNAAAENGMSALPGTPLSIWGSSLLGLYERVMPQQNTRSVRTIQLTGIGAEIAKGAWKWRSRSELLAEFHAAGDIAPDVLDAFEAQWTKGLEAVGGDPAWNDASEIHYLGYRNGLHGAGHIGAHMNSLRLLQQFSLAQLGHTQTQPAASRRGPFLGSKWPIIDMLAILDPQLAAQPYDTVAKAVTFSKVEDRLTAVGGLLSRSRPAATVTGSPSYPGPSITGINVASGYGLRGDSTAEDVLAVASQAIESAPVALRDLYERVLEHATYRIVKKELDPSSSGPSISKVMALRALTPPT